MFTCAHEFHFCLNLFGLSLNTYLLLSDLSMGTPMTVLVVRTQSPTPLFA